MEQKLLYEELLYFDQFVTELEIELFSIPRCSDFYYRYLLEDNLRRMSRIKKNIIETEKTKVYLKELDTLYQRLLYIKDIINAKTMPLGGYLNQITSIVHLVYTNNECSNIKLYSTSSFMFLCQFHREKTPSLGITEHVGCGYCFGCGRGFNAVQYLMERECLSYQEAVQLLSRIYLIDIHSNPLQENHPLVEKYRATLLSDNFRNLLERGYARVLKKDVISFDTLLSIQKYNHDFQTIERIEKGTTIPFDNHNKSYFLKMPTFSDSTKE